MRVTVDLGRCQGNAVCMGIAPEVFEVDEEGVLQILDPTPDESLRDRVLEAVDACPMMALSVED